MQVEAIMQALGGHAKSSGGAMVRCPAHDDKNPSLSIDERDGKLLLKCFAGCPNEAVTDALKARGLWQSSVGEGRSNTSDATQDATSESRIKAARKIWNQTGPAGRLISAYLRSRAITLPAPAALRQMGALEYPRSGQWFPAMVAGIQGPDGEFTGIHRAWLKPGGAGKAGVSSPKMALGVIGRGAVRLAEPTGHALGLAEGIETALSVIELYSAPCWAVLGGRNFQKVTIPDHVTEVVIFGDNGDKGREFAERGADRFSREGKTVKVVCPDPPYGDFNDLLQAQGVAA